jgi:hypothetical protein
MSTTLVRIRVAAALAGVAIAAAGLPAWIGTSSAAAAGPSGDGSDWSSTGLSKSSSTVTVRWDDPNEKNPLSSRVPRDGRQVLPHASGQTYDAISSRVVSQYFDFFGKDNGLGGLQMSVSQTKDLVNQSVNLEFSGVKGGEPFGLPSPVSLQVFQCWGGLTPEGRPDPGAADPDPATCQMGAGDPSSRSEPFALANSRYINSDPLVPGGDWDKYFNKGGRNDVPFTALNGKKSGSTNGQDNQFFNSATTNEVSRIQVSAQGTATRQFEVQTSLESAGLGCGLRRGVTSTRTCWLVVVPRVAGVLDQNGPIAPSLWAQRMQVKLSFRDIVAGCPGGQSRTLTAGSELLSVAAASWTPGLCTAKNIALGYTQLGDPVARTEFQNGAADAVLTTRPADKPAYYVPVALTAPVIAYALSYQPNCAARATPYTEDEAHTCGYDSVAELNADILRSGTLVRSLKLDARLVAKLLTQSYAFSIFDQEGFRRSSWMLHRPVSLVKDPEFLRLNPDLAHISPNTSSANNLDHLVLAALRSDAASAVWDWILKDDDGRAFLNGCPDPDGMVVNPFYSTRTYQGCEGQRTALAAEADANRRNTPTPASFADLPVTYPPDGSPFPLPGWQQADVDGNPPYTVFDFLPRVDSMPVAGRDVAIGYTPRSTNLCLTVLDQSCQPAPGKWTDPKNRQAGDRLGVMAITTAATAARFQLPTAQLCDSAGTHCVGADAASLTKAASRFVDGDAPGVQKAGPIDYGSGAYPLAQPVYAGVSKSLPLAERGAYADALTYVVTTGQKPGFAPGDLPPGYAPLPRAQLAQARTAIAALRAGASDPAPSPSVATEAPGGSGPDQTPAAGPSAPVGGPTAAPVTDGAQAAPQFVTLAAGTEQWPTWPLPLGLGIALVAGLAGPVLRFRHHFQIG